MELILAEYEKRCGEYSDINQHLPTLKRYAEQCEHITEMGVRTVVSTWAFLAARPKKLVSIDINPCPIESAKQLALENGIDFEFIIADTGSPATEIEPTDLLFIDTWHCYDQMKKELALHPSKARKYMIFHDTTTFAQHPEIGGYPVPAGFTHRGIWPAIEEFLVEHPEWRLLERYTHNNGLTILERV